MATAYGVLIAFAISLVETAMPLDPGRPVLGMSAVGAWILLMCVLLPNPPRVALLAGLAAAAMWPLAYAVNVGRHAWPLPGVGSGDCLAGRQCSDGGARVPD